MVAAIIRAPVNYRIVHLVIFVFATDNDISQGIFLPLLGFFGLSGNLVSIIVLSTPEMAANFFNRCRVPGVG